ncbi:uncharacterized protein LOC117187188 [Drosophila miranda]|uniref:uncharacterized protein LOC117187188 n=2 Tax=Drosophila miranda TaxID=7229 RepID=UPI00143F5798|nr:uncharacterized protein LOC117187188 [Drosophila miranda]
MIHEASVPVIQKMWYLKTNVTGEAENLIRHLSLTENNYTTAWNMLQERFSNKRVLSNALIQKLLDQPSTSNDAKSIKALHDNVKETLSALNNINIETAGWDPILLCVLTKKLDRQTHTLYEQSIQSTKKLQPLSELMKCLEQRFLTLEAIGWEKTKKPITCASAGTESQYVCNFCEKPNHAIYKCTQFLKKTVAERLNWVQKNQLCVKCFKRDHTAKNCQRRDCVKCNKGHNTLLHLEIKSEAKTAASANSSQNTYVLLATALVTIKGNNGQMGEFRALLDSGSQVNVISERALKILDLKVTKSELQINGIGGRTQTSKARVNVMLTSQDNKFNTRLEAIVLTHIVADQPAQSIDTSRWKLPKNITLADPNFDKTGRIDILLGAEHYFEIMQDKHVSIGKGLPRLQETKLGWIVAGKLRQESKSQSTCAVLTEEDKVDQQISKFWELDSFPSNTPCLSPLEKRCEQYFVQNIQMACDKKFIVRIPFLEDASSLGESRDLATRRLFCLEKRLSRDPETKASYVQFMKEYEALGHMKEMHTKEIARSRYFIPHHCVMKPDSSTTKLRVVFDASAVTSSGKSLNDLMHKGPTVQSSIFSILLRFRMHKYVFTADIEKMYRQIWVNPEDQYYQTIVWRNDPSEDLRNYRLKTVTYGAKAAPYLATKCLQYLAQKGKREYPAGADAEGRHDSKCTTGGYHL